MTVVDSHVNPPRPHLSPAEEAERHLHERVVARDELALLETFDRSGHLVFCTALLMSGHCSTAEALTVGLFAEYWRSPELFAPTYGPLALQMIRRLASRIPTRAGEPSARVEPAAAGRAA